MPSATLNPFSIVLFFLVTGLAAYGFGIPESVTATFVLVFFAVVTFVNPFNGIVFLLLATPFFLGESSWPYYWMTEALVFITILSAVIRFATKKERIEIPLKYPLALLLLASLCSIPIDGKEFYYDYWANSFADMYSWWITAHPKPKLHYLRVFTNMASGMALFLISFHAVRRCRFDTILSTFKAVVIMCGGVCVVGILLAYNIIPTNPQLWRYMTLSLVGDYFGSITVFAFALHFLGQYLLLVLPITLYLMYINVSRPAFLALYVAIFMLISFCLIQGGLRAAALLLYITVFIAFAFYIFHFIGNRKRGKLIFSGAGVLLVAVVSGYLLTKGVASQRFAIEILDKINSDTIAGIPNFINDPLFFWSRGIVEPRFFLWHTAVIMFLSSPLLGIGLGRFTSLFREYFASDWYTWEDIGFATNASSHSFYFETLANQGIIGFGLWGLLIWLILFGAVRTIRREASSQKKFFFIAIFSSIVIWLTIGLIHHVTLSRIIEIYFWISLGILAGYSWDEIKIVEPGRKKAVIAFAVIAAAFCYQIYLVMARPIPENFQTGFSSWEKKPDGNYYRWMGKRAVYSAMAKDGKVTLSLVVTLDGLEQKPQKVKIQVGESVKEIVINNRGLFTAEFPVKSKEGRYLVWLEVDHTYDPAKNRISRQRGPVGVMIMKPRENK
ncbi:hypothetical protein MNBD_NITROSPINAE02-1793 [hydrothermal vent metagenome]|uniref:O-antigen ligase-related domain-containing protein n=1 Tax=hydrothermal vent metagenome TaxID=652676 RepID=A0A3B1C6N4_9ZZZZ